MSRRDKIQRALDQQNGKYSHLGIRILWDRKLRVGQTHPVSYDWTAGDINHRCTHCGLLSTDDFGQICEVRDGHRDDPDATVTTYDEHDFRPVELPGTACFAPDALAEALDYAIDTPIAIIGSNQAGPDGYMPEPSAILLINPKILAVIR